MTKRPNTHIIRDRKSLLCHYDVIFNQKHLKFCTRTCRRIVFAHTKFGLVRILGSEVKRGAESAPLPRPERVFEFLVRIRLNVIWGPHHNKNAKVSCFNSKFWCPSLKEFIINSMLFHQIGRSNGNNYLALPIYLITRVTYHYILSLLEHG